MRVEGRELVLYDFRKKKQRGQKRKLSSLLKQIDGFQAYQNTTEAFEHFHLPCSVDFIDSIKTSGKVKTMFCTKWIETTARFIEQKPKELSFCKVVALISVPNYWDSQIIIYYDESYYNDFRKRTWRAGEQLLEQTTDKNMSFARERGIVTHLKEVGYIEAYEDDDYIYKSMVWCYGEL